MVMGVARHSNLRRVGVEEVVPRASHSPFTNIATLSQVGVSLVDEGVGVGFNVCIPSQQPHPVFYKRDTNAMRGVGVSYLARQAWCLSRTQSVSVGMPSWPYWVTKEETVLVWGDSGTAVVPRCTLFAVRPCVDRHAAPLAMRNTTLLGPGHTTRVGPYTVMFAASPYEIVNGYAMPIWLDMATVVFTDPSAPADAADPSPHKPSCVFFAETAHM